MGHDDTVLIRAETPADHDALDRLITAAFLILPISDGTEAQIVRGLRADSALWLSLVAERAGKPVGHVAVSRARVGAQSGWALFGPLAVTPDLHRRGIGGALMRAALDEVRGQAPGAVLVGSPAYYGRFGFRSFHSLRMDGVPQEFTLALPFGGAEPSGTLICHPAFGVEGGG